MATNYLYIRTSTKDQKYGLETQKQFLLDNIQLIHKNNDVQVVPEQSSAKSLETRSLLLLLENMLPNDVLYVYDMSRLTRADKSKESYQAIFEMIRERKAFLVVGLQLMDENNYEQELQNIIAGAIASYQRKVQNAKSKAGIAVKKQKGEWVFTGKQIGRAHV